MNGARMQPEEAAHHVSRTPPVYFYVPADTWPDDMTPDSGYFWSAKRGGKWNWTLQTYENLLKAGFPCRLVGEIPREGVIVAHTRLLDDSLVPNARQLLVCIEADRGRHPYAQLHVQQNPAGARSADAELRTRIDQRIVSFPTPNQYVCYWPQPDLIPRDSERGARFERVVYMGRAKNLAPALRSEAWSRRLREHGLAWKIEEDRLAWRDYREIDAILAVRDFAGEPHLHKPATKLHNAWRAGVPAVLGSESAFRADRRSELDYLEVNSPDEALAALLRLRDDVDLRTEMVSSGRRRAREVTAEAITASWLSYLRDVAIPAYDAWSTSSPLARRAFLLNRRLRQRFERLRNGIRRKLEGSTARAARTRP